jgi:hypothetical protein
VLLIYLKVGKQTPSGCCAPRAPREASLSVVDIDLLLLCILLGVRDFSREKQTTIAPGRPKKREEERACVCSRTEMNLIIFTRGRAALPTFYEIICKINQLER